MLDVFEDISVECPGIIFVDPFENSLSSHIIIPNKTEVHTENLINAKVRDGRLPSICAIYSFLQ